MQFLVIFDKYGDTHYKFFRTRYHAVKYATTELDHHTPFKVVELKEILRKGTVEKQVKGYSLYFHTLNAQ